MRGISFQPNIAKCLVIAICCVCIVAPITSAQEGNSEAGSRAHSLKDGAWALQFQFGSAFSSRGYEDIVISGKYHLSDGTAIRIGIDLDGSVRFGNSNRYFPKGDSLRDTNEFDYDRFGFDLLSEYILYSQPISNIHIFYGAGPLVKFYRDFRKDSYLNYINGEYRTSERETVLNNWSFGVSAVLGAEWFATKRISLIAEYGAEFEYSYITRETKTSDSDEGEYSEFKFHENAFDLDLKRVKMGIAIYF